MPPINRRNALPSGATPPVRRSARIRMRREAAAQAAARATMRNLRTEREEEPELTVIFLNREGRVGNGAAGRSFFEPHRPEEDPVVYDFLIRNGMIDLPLPPPVATVASVLNTTPPPLATNADVLDTMPPPVTGTGASTTPQAAGLSLTLSDPTSGGTGLQTSWPDAQTRALNRIKRDLLHFQREQPEGCQVELDGGNLFRWNATIQGPKGTPYEGGVFRLVLQFHQNYPFLPPKVYFVSKIYHCNVASSGSICIDILHSEWSPALTVAKVLVSIRSLLGDPNPEDPLETTLADLCKRRRHVYDENARLWTQRYAKPEMAEQTET